MQNKCPMTNEICNGESCILWNLKLGKCMLPRVTNCLFSIEREVKELRRELHEDKVTQSV